MAGVGFALRLDGVSKYFNKIDSDGITSAVRDVTLSFAPREFVCIVGTSGCGKSTLLRLIAGFIRPTEGRVTLNGREITGPGPNRGMVFQRPTLFPWLTVEKNLSFSLRMQKKYRGNEAKVDQMLRLIGLSACRKDYPGQLSGGMAQRVALARIIINQPEILLLDEPLSALDAFTRMNMQDEVLDIWRGQNQLAIMVTHDIEEAIYMGTRVLVMEANPGRVRRDMAIELPYPRNRSAEAFVAYRNEILQMLDYG